MEAVKRILKVPKNHELTLKVPSFMHENDIVEVIVIIKKKNCNFNEKIEKLKATLTDPDFQNDIKEIEKDYVSVDGDERKLKIPANTN